MWYYKAIEYIKSWLTIDTVTNWQNYIIWILVTITVVIFRKTFILTWLRIIKRISQLINFVVDKVPYRIVRKNVKVSSIVGYRDYNIFIFKHEYGDRMFATIRDSSDKILYKTEYTSSREQCSELLKWYTIYAKMIKSIKSKPWIWSIF